MDRWTRVWFFFLGVLFIFFGTSVSRAQELQAPVPPEAPAVEQPAEKPANNIVPPVQASEPVNVNPADKPAAPVSYEDAQEIQQMLRRAAFIYRKDMLLDLLKGGESSDLSQTDISITAAREIISRFERRQLETQGLLIAWRESRKNDLHPSVASTIDQWASQLIAVDPVPEMRRRLETYTTIRCELLAHDDTVSSSALTFLFKERVKLQLPEFPQEPVITDNAISLGDSVFVHRFELFEVGTKISVDQWNTRESVLLDYFYGVVGARMARERLKKLESFPEEAPVTPQHGGTTQEGTVEEKKEEGK
ncbi:hypothetical protein HY625_02140 [Candidatus Uhrbacteria bacterium]|nr:hypothetical protein [Candidatus Uhrbacteria bacterium]